MSAFHPLVLIALCLPLAAGEAGPPLSPGVAVAFMPFGASEAIDARVARAVALHAPAGESPTPFLAPGRFTAVFDGVVTMDVWEQVVLSVEGLGAASVTVNGVEALADAGPALGASSAPLKFKTGINALRVRYDSPANGAAELRLLWRAAKKPEAKGRIPLEPIPTTQLGHDPAATPALAGFALRAHGRALVGELRCVKCHAPGELPPTAMPELALDAPSFPVLAARLDPAWMARWIEDPRALRPTATMPRLLQDGRPPEAVAQAAADLAAAIAAMGAPAADLPPGDAAAIDAGGRLYVRLGCMGCHESGAADDVPLDQTAMKWRGAGLVDYLRDPATHYAANPMPDFALTAEQAAQVAAYLRARFAAAAPAGPVGDAARGQALLATEGCLNCHIQPNAVPAAALAQVAAKASAGCLGDDAAARGAAPDYALTPDDRAALRAFLASGIEPLGRRCLDEFAERRIDRLRCAACHTRDGVDSAWARGRDARAALAATFVHAPAEPAPTMYADRAAPQLTQVGDKLRPEWMAPYIAGTATSVRPWLNLRMPGFAWNAELIAQGLAQSHGHPPRTPADPPTDPALAAIGEQLVHGADAFTCGQCHAIGAQPATQVFEYPGIDLALAPQRLRHAFYRRWMHDPARIEPGVGMTQFGDDNGLTGKPQLEGRAAAQYDAIWHHLRSLPAP